MQNISPTKQFPVSFFMLTFLFSVPFYVLNTLAYLNILGEPKIGALYIAMFTFTPVASASILTFRRSGSQGLKELLGRMFDFKRIVKKRWYVVILLLMPVLYLLTIEGLVLLVAKIPSALVPLVALPVVILFFLLLAAGEEVGWMGYAFDPMQTSFGALKAALILGIIWACWHIPIFVFVMQDPVVLITQILTLVGNRVLVVWIFNNTGNSVFAAILFHAVDNTVLVTIPEINAVIPLGSGIFCSLVLITAFIVIFLWGSRTLAQYRFGKQVSTSS